MYTTLITGSIFIRMKVLPFITVRDNWTEGEKYLQNANGPGNVWENNGPKVDSVIRERAGLEAGYKDLLNIQ